MKRRFLELTTPRRSRGRAVCAAIVGMSLPVVLTSHAATTGPEPAPSDPAPALAALDRRVADLDTEELSGKIELARLGVEAQTAHARAVLRGRSLFKLTRAGLLPVGGGFGALVSYAMLVERARHELAMSLRAERQARARAANVEHDLERAARDREDLASQRSAMVAAQMAMADEQRRQAAFERAFQTSTGGAGEYVAVYTGSGLAADTQPSAFANARGRLLFPVLGRTEVRPARRDGTEGPGLEILAAAGSVVRAVFAGRVAFADRYGPYGRIIILDHGDRYFTVNGNLDSIEVRIGQEVSAGQRIGTVGDDGQGPMLYFEVRHMSQTIAPGAWLGL